MDIFTRAFLKEVFTVPFDEAINSFNSGKLYKFHWELNDLDSPPLMSLDLGNFT